MNKYSEYCKISKKYSHRHVYSNKNTKNCSLRHDYVFQNCQISNKMMQLDAI